MLGKTSAKNSKTKAVLAKPSAKKVIAKGNTKTALKSNTKNSSYSKKIDLKFQ